MIDGPALAAALQQVFKHARDESLRLRGFGRGGGALVSERVSERAV